MTYPIAPTPGAADTDWLPIREVAERTGINPATLRAWERRYGLIKPQRSPKGHRLYTTDDVARIEQIRQWLARGVAVSQVAQLLQPSPLTEATETSHSEPEWQPLLDDAFCALQAGNLSRFDQQLNQISAIYPAALLMHFFWHPLLEQIFNLPDGERKQLMQLQLESFLRNRAGARLLHRNLQHKNQQRLLLTHLPSAHPRFDLWLAVLTCADLNIPVLLLDELPDWSLLHLIGQQQPLNGVLLFGNEKQPALKQSEQQLLKSLPFPCCLAGPLARIQPEPFADNGWQIITDWVHWLNKDSHDITAA